MTGGACEPVWCQHPGSPSINGWLLTWIGTNAMDPLAKLKLYLVSSDPGHVGLRMGVRVMLTVAAVCLALFVLGRWVPMNAPSYVLGMITAIQGAAQINDPTIGERAVTRVYAALGGFIAIAGISLVESSLVLVDLWLLIVIFVATYSRRFGPRWQAVGVFTFMCGVVGAFLRAPERDLVEIALALLVSGVVAHLVRNYVVPERPSRDFRRVVAGTLSLSQQLRQLIGAVSATQKDMRWNDALLIAGWLRSDIRMCQNYLPLKVEGPHSERNSDIVLRLLDLQLATETALDASSASALRRPEADPGSVKRELDEMQEAEQRLQDAVAQLPASFPEGASSVPRMPPAKPLPARGEWLNDPQFRLAIQVTLACAIAMVGGRLISSDRWFWAVMAAFLIFMNTQSAGAVAVRGISRAMGTLAGIVLGIGLATLVRGDLYLTIPLVGISIFGAFYLARISYVGMNICINVAISLIYGLVGIFKPELLVLRLEETAIGAAAGIFAALAVLPVRTASTADRAMNRLYLSLKQLTAAIINIGADQQNQSMTAAAGAVDKAFADVVKAYDPMRSFWAMGTAEAKTRNPLRRAYLLAHAAHLLEHSFRQTRPTDSELQELAAIQDRLAIIAGEGTAADLPASAADDSLKEHETELAIADEPVRYALEIMSEILRQVEAGE